MAISCLGEHGSPSLLCLFECSDARGPAATQGRFGGTVCSPGRNFDSFSCCFIKLGMNNPTWSSCKRRYLHYRVPARRQNLIPPQFCPVQHPGSHPMCRRGAEGEGDRNKALRGGKRSKEEPQRGDRARIWPQEPPQPNHGDPPAKDGASS